VGGVAWYLLFDDLEDGILTESGLENRNGNIIREGLNLFKVFPHFVAFDFVEGEEQFLLIVELLGGGDLTV
jgi:hypothetical protein